MSKFAPKEPVELDPPKTDSISREELAAADGTDENKPVWVAIKGVVYDVTSKRALYGPEGGYHLFAGKDASRALAMSSTKPEDASPVWYDLPEKEKETLAGWVSFFSQRYNQVGLVEGAANL
jgi:membrane-associated progesterone receptor component